MQKLKSRVKPVLAAVAAVLGLGLASPAAQAQAGYTQTRYPIVLAHGLFGFGNIGPVNYFFGVPSALQRDGATVYTPQQSAANTAVVRGEQLLAELLRLQAVYGHVKFNLIGHSQGGQVVRYVAGVRPDLVASVTTIGTPHQGAVSADLLAGAAGSGAVPAAVGQVVNVLGTLISTLGGSPGLPQDGLSALGSLSTPATAAFNAYFPAGAPTTACGSGAAVVNGVRYYSAAGTSTATNLFDPDSLLALTGLLYGAQANDGLVSRCSARWGTVLRDNYPWNHLDQVNQTFGLRGWLAPDPVAFYRTHANRLKSEGL